MPIFRRRDEAARGLDAGDRAAVDANAGDFALLDDVDAERIGGARIAPGDGVVAHGAAARLQQAAHDRKARVRSSSRDSESIARSASRDRNSASMPFSRIALPRRIAASMSAGECTRFSTPRALYITLKLSSLRQPLPQLQRILVEVRVRIEVIVRAHDGRVAPGVAAAEPAFFQHGDIAHAVLFGEVVGGGEPVPAAADDHRVVMPFRRRAAPGQRPVLVETQRVAGERENGIAHGRRMLTVACAMPKRHLHRQ